MSGTRGQAHNLSGFVGPFVTGWLTDLTGSSRAGMWVVAAMMLMSAAIALAFRRTTQRAAAGDEPRGSTARRR
ncbi:MFS transporter [Pseudonocardia sp. ICBG1293]|uniref:MFS transporter n=1 Tax=Pseudonocardia sp. ICBG1293 TaxID=2844382 RepID=UPI001CCF04A4|nr:MFS transporter [Pseudonocardia sp. ICBG1293]